MLKVPSHISKTRNGIYYFRFVIPKNLRDQLHYKREFTRSLQTESKHVAIKRARMYMVEMDEVLEFLEAKKRGESPSQSWTQLKNVKLKDGTTIGEITIDDAPEQESKLVAEILGIETVSPPVVQSSNFPETLLSEVIEKYCEEKTSLKEWSDKTAMENSATFTLFSRIVGDVVFSTLKYEQLREYKEKFLKLPPNINKIERYRGKTVDEVLRMDNVKPMARNTQNKHLNRVHGLFVWAVRQGYTDKNFASGLAIGKDKNAQDKRDPFTNTDLKKLFESAEYQEHKLKNAHYYWVPLIALYTGARLNEICQLHIEDIRPVNDLYVFDFNEGEEDKRLKTKSSRRIVPIHSKLISLGLITYFIKLKLQKEKRLFPEIKRGRDGYGDAVSKWFSRYRKKQGVDDGKKKVFHSFRHSVVNHLKQQKVAKEIIAAIVGHGEDSVTFGVYGDKYNPEILHEYIEMLDFDVEFTKFYEE